MVYMIHLQRELIELDTHASNLTSKSKTQSQFRPGGRSLKQDMSVESRRIFIKPQILSVPKALLLGELIRK